MKKTVLRNKVLGVIEIGERRVALMFFISKITC